MPAAKYSKSWLEFLTKVEQAKEELEFGTNEECFYRGHTHTSHKLLPGILRGVDIIDDDEIQRLWGIESDLFYEFRAKARELHSQNMCDWDILIFMQHHGVRTRLLDWTESLGVAVYFSLLNYNVRTSRPCIWVMNPYKLNDEYHDSRDLWDPMLLYEYGIWNEEKDEDGKEEKKENEPYSQLLLYTENYNIFPWDEPIALYPVRRVDRLATQSGYFTLHGNDSRPLEKIISARRNIWKKIEIPKSAIYDAFTFLDHAGINQFTLFPDLDGLSKNLNHKYFDASDIRKQAKKYKS